MVFILEGCDKCGKSTLADKLVKEFNAVYLKFSAPKRPAFKEYSDCLDMLQVNRHYVLDRFCYGELIYGPLYRKKSQLTLDDLRYLETRLLAFDPVVICCLTDATTVRDNFVRCHETETNIQHVEKIIRGFQRLLLTRDRLVPVRIYDYQKDPSHEQLFDDLKLTMLNGQTLRQHELMNFLGNSACCEYLFVGDEKNVNRLDRHVFDSVSGRFLLRALDRLKILNRSGICNSLVGNELLDRDMVRRLAPRTIIALGAAADLRLSLIGLEHRRVAHPQFAKRFYGKSNLEKYQRKLREVLS